ncbi:glyoxalase superfamily protein [Lederbergia citrea]|nr:glyoxalase superfamily protein [Lederbergia citrea]
MSSPTISMNGTIPILRIFDEQKAREFYQEFLEFAVDWEHRFEEDLPLYMQISYDQCVIHLSEHHGDSSPGSGIRISVKNIEELHTRLLSKKYKYARPGLEDTPWNTKEITIGDPFGNRIIFYEDK